ncbi:hypothetical protein ACWEFJ_28315 [Actinosynnema sp. NPDC004786]
MTTAQPAVAAVPPELTRELMAVLDRHGYRMADMRGIKGAERVLERIRRAAAEFVNAFTDAPPFEGVTAPAQVGAVVRRLHEVSLDALSTDGVDVEAAGAGDVVRIVCGHLRFPVAEHVARRAAWLFLEADVVEVAGTGPGVRHLVEQLGRQVAEQRSATHP